VALAIPRTVPSVPFVAIIVVIPGSSAVNTPVAESIVPTVVLVLVQNAAGLIDIEPPFWSEPTAVKACVWPTSFDALAGETVMVVSTGFGVEDGYGSE